MSFESPYVKAPIVATFLSGNLVADYADVVISANERTPSGFVLYVLNGSSKTYKVAVGWIAVG